ncbi:hypothetical protein HanRHA438_Chr04g0183811 [Helianthus annuus]|uniref:Uncharacterized protein n=1 Tax=Helianthus annuus TaxID=4232 RepID=A0A9K3NRV3_HELAN|nr:hypothetical protein HanXRQr2_Chr04g0174091 [Helianthus annuus]KAJ0761843.1 hypothetical protein HanOQP8_Chr04g0154641 [Helianthus annuus]KAJ0927520.1 hypothetical protein HanRHA438_Chr04g0183811 [Helianthus annuus]KAJ0931936.1 hypothetical protein HanPSC8_Chr04g0167741 [Helianthus annuus]
MAISVILRYILFYYVFLETDVLINGKVDWKGRPATKNKHGGMHAAMFVLGGFFGFILLNSKYYLEK